MIGAGGQRKVFEGYYCINSDLLQNPFYYRRLYWFEEHAEGPRLISSDLNGGRRNILANASRKVYGLTVDVNASRVYWMLDTTLHSLTWDGRDEKIVNIAPRFPVGMKFFRNNIYTCESENSHSVALTISAINVTNGRKSVLLFDPLEWCGDITAFYTPQLGKAFYLNVMISCLCSDNTSEKTRHFNY